MGKEIVREVCDCEVYQLDYNFNIYKELLHILKIFVRTSSILEHPGWHIAFQIIKTKIMEKRIMHIPEENVQITFN